jgi:hypothetical protein
MKTDNVVLTSVIEDCLRLSMDGRVSPENRSEFLALGKRLRGTLVNLLTAEFENGTAEVTAANAEINAIHNQLVRDVTNLNDTIDRLKKVNQLVTSLDGLIKFALKFA